jgi:WD40 repeat protein
MLGSGSTYPKLRLWRVTDQKLILTLHSYAPVYALAYSPSGTALAAGLGDGTIRVWDAAAGTLLGTLEGHAGTVGALAFSPDGRLLFSAGADGTLRVWNVQAAKQLRILQGQGGTVSALAIAPDGTLLAAASLDGTVRLWAAR